MNEIGIDSVYLQSAALSFLGGIVFALSSELLVPSFDIPRLTIRKTVVAIVSVAALFWSTWMIPQVILLASTNRPAWVIILLTGMFFFYIVGLVVTTWALGKRKGSGRN